MRLIDWTRALRQHSTLARCNQQLGKHLGNGTYHVVDFPVGELNAARFSPFSSATALTKTNVCHVYIEEFLEIFKESVLF